jgi:hypothetical protein
VFIISLVTKYVLPGSKSPVNLKVISWPLLNGGVFFTKVALLSVINTSELNV